MIGQDLFQTNKERYIHKERTRGKVTFINVNDKRDEVVIDNTECLVG